GPSLDQYGQYGVASVGVGPTLRASQDHGRRSDDEGDDDESGDGGDQGRGRSAIYVGTGHGPFRSDDGGNTFVAIHDGYATGVNDLGLDATGRFLVPGWHGIPLFRGASPGAPRPYDPIGDNAAPPGAGDR